MSRSSRIFGLIQPQVPGTVLCGDNLIIKPTGYIARGFGLETTSHKDHVKLWRIVMPLYRPFDNVVLSYSQLIAGEHAGLVHIDQTSHKSSAANLFERIAGHVQPLRKLSSPQDFLNYISWMAGTRSLNVRTDVALTHYLLGNTQEALRMFRQLDVDLNDYQAAVQEISRPLFRQVLDLLESDPSDLRAVIESWRAETIKRLGLSESVATPVLRLVGSQ